MAHLGDDFPANYFERLLQLERPGTKGITNTEYPVSSGEGQKSALSLAISSASIKPFVSDGTTLFTIKNLADTTIFAVDSTNTLVKAGISQANVLTMEKEMGLYQFSPNTAGYHYPLISNKGGMQGAEALTYDDDWGNATDPPTSLDVSGLTDPENAIAVFWYLDHNITLDSVRYLARCDTSATLNFHLYSYTIDTSTNYGDLSAGVVNANTSVSAASATIRTGTFSLNTANIDAGKVVVGVVENATDTGDISVNFNIKYHIR